MTTDDVNAGWANTVIQDLGVDLLRYLARRAAAEDVPDLLNDTLSVVWQRRADLPKTSIDARMWAFGVARNTLRKHRHNHSKRTRLAEALRSVIRSGATPVLTHLTRRMPQRGAKGTLTSEQPSERFVRAIAS